MFSNSSLYRFLPIGQYGRGRWPAQPLHVQPAADVSLAAAALQRFVQAAVEPGAAVHAAVQSDLRLQHAVGQQGGPGCDAAGVPLHHLLA